MQDHSIVVLLGQALALNSSGPCIELSQARPICKNDSCARRKSWDLGGCRGRSAATDGFEKRPGPWKGCERVSPEIGRARRSEDAESKEVFGQVKQVTAWVSWPL